MRRRVSEFGFRVVPWLIYMSLTGCKSLVYINAMFPKLIRLCFFEEYCQLIIEVASPRAFDLMNLLQFSVVRIYWGQYCICSACRYPAVDVVGEYLVRRLSWNLIKSECMP